MEKKKMYPIYVAKAKLSELIDRALKGEKITISRGKEAKVELVPVEAKVKREFGAMRGEAIVTKEFFEPLDEDELKAWE